MPISWSNSRQLMVKKGHAYGLEINASLAIQPGSQRCIVTGLSIELVITLIVRMKRLFQNRATSRNSRSDRGSIQFDTKETIIELNGVHIQAYPSNHLNSIART
jgi:hypothetical protein